MFPESKGTKFWSHSFPLQNSVILQVRMDQGGGDSWKWILTIFKYKNEYHKQLYLYSPERPQHALVENNMFYRDLSNSSQDIQGKNIKKVLIQHKFTKIHQLQTLISSKL